MTDLASMRCIPCIAGAPTLGPEEQAALLAKLRRGWRIVDGHHLERRFELADFAQALAFTNEVGRVAEEQGHHPDLHLSWGAVRATIWTHKADGLTENDFILAAKLDELADRRA